MDKNTCDKCKCEEDTFFLKWGVDYYKYPETYKKVFVSDAKYMALCNDCFKGLFNKVSSEVNNG
jgi:hypothetical protein